MGSCLAKNRSTYSGSFFETTFDKRQRQELEVKYTMQLEAYQKYLAKAVPKKTWGQKPKTKFIVEVVQTPWKKWKCKSRSLDWEKEMEVSECFKAIGYEFVQMNQRDFPGAHKSWHDFHKFEMRRALEGQSIDYKNHFMYNGNANSMDPQNRNVKYDYTDESFALCLRHRKSEHCVVAAMIVEKTYLATTISATPQIIWEVPWFTTEPIPRRNIFGVYIGGNSWDKNIETTDKKSSSIQPEKAKSKKKTKELSQEETPGAKLFRIIQLFARYQGVTAINFTAPPHRAAWFTSQNLEKGCRFVPQIIYAGDKRNVYNGVKNDEERECLQSYFKFHQKPINGDVALYYRNLHWRIKFTVGVHIWLFVRGKLNSGITQSELHPRNRSKQQRAIKAAVKLKGVANKRKGGYSTDTNYKDSIVAKGQSPSSSRILRDRASQGVNEAKTMVY